LRKNKASYQIQSGNRLNPKVHNEREKENTLTQDSRKYFFFIFFLHYFFRTAISIGFWPKKRNFHERGLGLAFSGQEGRIGHG